MYIIPHNYRLSIEHAAIAQMLTAREVDVLLALGRGLSNREVAARLGTTELTACTYVRDLKERTGMNRLKLAVLGYALLGQVEDARENLPAAA